MTSERQRTHFVCEYFHNPVHPISIDLVGCGGNGSMMMSCLASINQALLSLDHPGLSVTAYDPDTVSEANIGRQLFGIADLGCNKADALVTRFNRIFGTDWRSIPEKYKFNKETNIIITCTDNVESRKAIGREFKKNNDKEDNFTEFHNYYWLDLGNSQTKGQAILGSILIRQPISSQFESVEKLPTVTEMFHLSKKDDKDSGPSCSLAEALEKQDLFINRCLASEAADLLWHLLRNHHIEYHGFFKNLEEMKTVPIPF